MLCQFDKPCKQFKCCGQSSEVKCGC